MASWIEYSTWLSLLLPFYYPTVHWLSFLSAAVLSTRGFPRSFIICFQPPVILQIFPFGTVGNTVLWLMEYSYSGNRSSEGLASRWAQNHAIFCPKPSTSITLFHCLVSLSHHQLFHPYDYSLTRSLAGFTTLLRLLGSKQQGRKKAGAERKGGMKMISTWRRPTVHRHSERL